METFVCPLQSCRRSFGKLAQFLRHLRRHEVTRPHQCGRCVERFSSPDALTHHAHAHMHHDQMHGRPAMQKWAVLQGITRNIDTIDCKTTETANRTLSSAGYQGERSLLARTVHRGHALLDQHIGDASCQGFIRSLTEINPLLMELRGKPSYSATDMREVITGVMSSKQGVQTIKNIARYGYYRNVVDLLDLVGHSCPWEEPFAHRF